MILFTILVCVAIALAIIGLFATIAAGGSFLIAYADIIVCALLIVLIVKFIVRRKKK